MPLIRADRVKESSTSTSTSAFLLNGADSTYRTFASVCAVGDTVYYAIAHRSANEWEVGLGTYSAVNTLTRTTVHASSNANAAVAFSTGTKDVLLALTKAQLETYATLAGTETLTNKTISGANNTITNVSLTTGATGTLPLANGGTGTTTAQLAINALAGAVTSGSYLRGNGTNVVMAAIQAADVPTLNQNTTGTASGSVSGTASYVPKFTGTNVVGNSQIVDNGTSVGIGTSSPSAKLHVYSTASPQLRLEGTSDSTLGFYRSNVNGGYIGLGSPGNNDIYIYNLNSGAVRINNQAVYVTATNLVGVNEQSPGAQLQVTTAAAATKGLIVKGASAQSANLLELQNSAGTVVASVDPSGIAVFGAQTGAQNSSVIRAWSTPANALNGQILTSLTGANGGNERYRMSIGNTSSYGFLQTYENAIGYTMSLALQPLGGNVGIGTTAPSVKLDTVGAVRSSGYTVGHDGTYLELTGDLPGYPANRYPTLRSDGSIYFAVSGRYAAYLYSVDNSLNIANTSNQWRVGLNPSGTSYFAGGALAVGSTTAPAGQLYVAPQAAATKGLVVRGASAQNANLQEWQNNSGTALASVDSAGNLVTPQVSATTIAGPETIYNTNGTGHYKEYYITRTLPDTVGDYVELLEFPHTVGTRFKIDVMVADYPYWDNSSYEFSYWWDNSSGVIPPKFRYHRNTSDFVLEKFYGQTNPYVSRLRLKRTGAKSSAASSTVRVRVEVWASLVGGLPTDASATGTSALSSAYVSDQSFCNPILQPPPPVPSGDGSSVSVLAANAVTTGAGGSISLAPGNSAGVAAPGFINLNLPQPADGSQASCVTLGLYKTHYLTRTVPITAGDYVEICEIPDNWVGRIKISIMTYQHAAEGGSFKSYDFSPTGLYNASGIIQPIAHNGANGWELEKYVPSVTIARLRIRRTVTISASPACDAWIVIERLDYINSLLKYSGTGTSAVANTLLSSSLVAQTLIQPGPPVANNGAGKDITVRGGNAAGTGAGGSILLQAGAFSTSGSNGKVIVRGLASNTANLQEWQNNAGSQLSAVNSAGDFTNTGGQTQSERFGSGAAVSAAYTTSIGCLATAAGQSSSAVGWSSTTSGVHAVAVGASSSAGEMSVAVGRGASTTTGAVAIGLSATAYNNGISIGRSSSSSGIMLGYQYSGAGVGYTTLSASADGRSATGAIEIVAGDGVNYNTNYSRQHSILGTWATATYASRLGRVQLRVNDYTTDREAIRYESDGTNALTSIGGSAIIANTTLAVQPAVSGNKGIVVKGASGQSANLLELQNSSGQIGLSISVNQFGEATFVNGPRYISTAPEFSAGLLLQFQDSTIDRLNVKMHGTGSIGFAALSASNTSLDTYVSRGDAGVLRVNAASGAGGSIAITSSTPSAFTADQNNLALTASGFQRLSGTAARNITGIAPPSGSHVDGRMIRIYNVGSFNLTLKHNSTSSTAANRFWNVQAIDIIVGANDYAELIYDGTNNGSGAAGWRVA